jgi:glycolate oxidase iron-sulfur subunit
MQTNLSKSFRQNTAADVVDQILRKCVHCGFCNATCPTYQLRGDELDGPRGRIYQMKQYFEGTPANSEMLKHLDRCLTCRSCETTCPSGVKYSRLLEIGKEEIEQELPRSAIERIKRWVLTRFLNSGWLFGIVLQCGRLVSPLLPASISNSIPVRQTPISRPERQHTRRVLMLSGCVQPALSPNTNVAAARILDYLGITSVEINARHCCGAVGLHTSQSHQGRQQAQKLIDLWWPHVESGVEAIITTATGCGLTVREYQALFADDPEYSEKAKTISELVQDFSQLVLKEMSRFEFKNRQNTRVAFHTPCSMQHGLGLNGIVEKILDQAGYQICRIADSHLCCGSAGTYSLLQPEMSSQLRANKQFALSVDSPDVIATANIGCQMQIANGSDVPVVHWNELLLAALDQSPAE